MKKLFYVIGALVTAASVFALIAILLKKLKISLTIEGLDDEGMCDCGECEDCASAGDNISVTIDGDELCDDDIEVEFTQEDDDDIDVEIEKEILEWEEKADEKPAAPEKKTKKSSK